MIDGYLDKDKVAVFTEDVTRSLDKVAGLDGAQIEAGVNDGTIVIPKELRQLVAAQLERKGIRKIRDLKRLNGVEAAMARAAIIASSEDVNIRKQYATEMVNILDNTENSPNMNSNNERTFANAERTNNYRVAKLRQDIGKTRRSWNDAANKEAANVLAGAQDIFFGVDRDEENFNYDSAVQFLRSNPFNKFNLWLKQTDRTDPEIANAMPGMGATLSLTIAAMAGEQSGGLRESVIDFMGRDEVGEGVDPADFDASRLRVDDFSRDEDGKSNATKIYYTDEDGNILDEDAGLDALKSIAPGMFNNAMEIAIYNTRSASEE